MTAMVPCGGGCRRKISPGPKNRVRICPACRTARRFARTGLNAKKVRAIRAARMSGEPIAECAARFGISAATISRIATGKRWAHVV